MKRMVLPFLIGSFLVFASSVTPVSAQSWYPQPQKRLTIGGTLVDALADFQRHGGQVDEILTPDDLAGKPPLLYGIQNGRSVFAIGGGRGGGLAGLITVDGSSVEASMTPDGFLELKADQTGVRNRNMQLYRALFPDQDLSEYTTEAVFEYIDESGTRFIFGGSEDGKTTSFLFKKDPATGELVYKIRRDIIRNKEAKVGWVEPDESSTFPVRFKICDENRDNCVVRNIIKKPGDEIRINPKTQAIKLTFNTDQLPYYKKYGNAERLSWACLYKGEGFYFTYREGFMGGDPRKLGPLSGTLSCNKNVLSCNRTGPGQKCNFDFKDYLDEPPTMLLFGLNWLTSRLDPHKQHFTITLDPTLKHQLRFTKFENIGAIKTRKPMFRPASLGDDTDRRLYQTFKAALCPDVGGACSGEPAFSVLETTGVRNGTTLVDERTGVRLKNITHATLYVLRNDYGTGKMGDFVGAVVDNRAGGSVVSTLKFMEDRPQAPDLLDKKDEIAPDNIKAILAEIEKEEHAEEIQRTVLADRQRALVLFPTRHGWGFASQPAGARKAVIGRRRPAKVIAMPSVEERQPPRLQAVAPPPQRRSLTSRYGTSAPPTPPAYVKPPSAYARPALVARPVRPSAESRSIASGVPFRPTTTARAVSPPPSNVAEPSMSAYTDRTAPYRTASAQLGSSEMAPRTAFSAVRPRVPLRLPVKEEGLTQQAVTAVRPVRFEPASASPSAWEPAPSPQAVAPERVMEARVVAPEPVSEVQAVAPKPVTKPRAVAPKPHTRSPVRVTRSLVREVQRRLKRQGYPVGRIDGRLGRRTVRAIRRFQEDVSLHPTGRVDRNMIASLGIDANNGWSAKPVAKTRRVRKVRSKRWKPTKIQIKEVQRRLALIGYNSGSADGFYGRRTAKAVKDFQRRAGLKPTGRINRKVLHRLSIER